MFRVDEYIFFSISVLRSVHEKHLTYTDQAMIQRQIYEISVTDSAFLPLQYPPKLKILRFIRLSYKETQEKICSKHKFALIIELRNK